MENVKILICDDSILARKQLKDIIVEHGYQDFLEASNGQEAIDLYKEHKPELVFVDIVMPVKDGVQAIHEIREFDPEANIIVVSSVGTQTQLRNAIMEGARDFVQKPYTNSGIADILKARFGGR
ncbi:MAG: response regulator [Lachnospiraceae bacterium]|jgi:Response regulator containing CheY-like receiver domain and AraC-type DNA-binding domain|nr:response regulator [Lachnospiraceae bacterium]